MNTQNQDGAGGQKGNIGLIIAVVVAAAILAGGIGYFTAKKMMVKEGAREQRLEEVVNLEQLANFNPEFKSFLNELTEKNPSLSINKFTIEGEKEINIISEGFSPYNSSWTHSPDKTRAVFSLGYYGQPDSSLEIYNRKGDQKIELLKTCGTPCGYQGEFWLDNEQFVFIQDHEYYPSNGEARCLVGVKCTRVVDISLYDLGRNTETVYQSPEVDHRQLVLPSWPNRVLQVNIACESLYGKESAYCQK